MKNLRKYAKINELISLLIYIEIYNIFKVFTRLANDRPQLAVQPVRSVSNEHVRRVVKAELLALARRSSQRTLDANASQVNEQASEQERERDRAIVIEGSSSICEAHQFIVFSSWQQTAGATTTGNGSKHFKWRLFSLRVFSRIAIKQTNHSYNLRKRILIPNQQIRNKY